MSAKEFPICTVKINPDHKQYPLTPSLGTYSINDVTACIALDCWGIYIQKSDLSIETIYNMYYYDNMNRSYDIHNNSMEQYKMEEQVRLTFINQPGLLLNKINCKDTLVIILYKVQPCSIHATRLSEYEWDISVYLKLERKLSNRFSFEPSDIQRMEEKKIEHYSQTILTLENKVKMLDNMVQTLDSKQKSTIIMYETLFSEKLELQLENQKLLQQIEEMEKIEQSKFIPVFHEEQEAYDTIQTEKSCGLS